MDDYEPPFPRGRMLSYISEGLEDEFDDDTSALDDSGRSSRNGLRASAFLGLKSTLEVVEEDDNSARNGREESVCSASSRGRSVASGDSRRSSRLRRSYHSSSLTSQSKSLRSSIQSTTSRDTATSVPSMNSASAPLVFTQHSLKQVATREVNIHENPFAAMDESLPEEYSDSSLYDHELILPVEKEDSIVSSEGEDDYRMISLEDRWRAKKSFTLQRKTYTFLTILGAVSLCVIGIIVAVQVLATSSSISFSPNYNAEYFYIPRYDFGGGSGGITGIRDDGVRRFEDSQYYGTFEGVPEEVAGSISPALKTPPTSQEAPKLLPVTPAVVAKINPRSSSLRSSILKNVQDQFKGFGPRQFNPIYDGHNIQEKSLLTSSALASYNPPNDSTLTIVLDPMFNGAMMDVSVLPVTPELETPVFWDVQMTGVPRMQYIFGHCLKLVQCSEVGKDLLIRQFEDDGEATPTQGDSTLIVDGVPSNYDPPLNVEYIHASKFVNVDCSKPHGIERGLAHDLATSNMVDIIYTPNILDAARLFAPPIEAYGRSIVIMRHPVERIVALYEYMKVGRSVGSVRTRGMSLGEFANSGK